MATASHALCAPRASPAPLTADRSAAVVGGRLLRFLCERLGVRGLRYAKPPALVPDGWITYIFHFQLEAVPGLPAEFLGPLTLRLFACAEAAPHGRREFAVQAHMRRLDYPVPAPVLWEESADWLGGPFLLMEQVRGPTLLQRLLRRPWTFGSMASWMAEMQHQLHELPADGFPAEPGPFLERTLAEIDEVATGFGLRAVQPALGWLRDHQPAPPPTPRILHLDIHPMNLIHRRHQLPVVLDWDTADVGDPHADVATTLMLLRCAANVGTTLWERVQIASGRELLRACYLASYRRRAELERAKLDYYRAWAALRRLTTCARWLIGGPLAAGAKPSLVRHLPAGHVKALCRDLARVTGVAIPLDEKSWEVQPV